MSLAIYNQPQFMLFSALIAELQNVIKERAAKQADFEQVMQRAIDQFEEIDTYAWCDDITLDGTGCGTSFPCCGVERYELWVLAGCPDCWEFQPSHLECGVIRTPLAMCATGKLVVFGRNRYLADANTAADATYDATTGDYTVYLDGQPEIPPFGFIQHCQDIYFYYCKSGKNWPTDEGIDFPDHLYYDEDETDFLPEELHEDPDFSAVAGFRPYGNHTALSVRTGIRCGRLDNNTPLELPAGSTIQFPLAFYSRLHINALLWTAAEMLYARLVSSCSRQRDIERYTAMQDHYAKRAAAARATMPRLRKKRVMRKDANDFRSSLSLYPRRSPLGYGRTTRECCGGC